MATIEFNEPCSEWLTGRGSKKLGLHFFSAPEGRHLRPKVRIEKETEIGQLAIYSTLSWLAQYDDSQ